jgi:hypothetical protein
MTMRFMLGLALAAFLVILSATSITYLVYRQKSRARRRKRRVRRQASKVRLDDFMVEEAEPD